MTKILYRKVGEDYEKKDPIKKLAQTQASLTAKNIFPFEEFPSIRGESAYVWKQGKILMASVIEGLGTKNLIADDMRLLTGKDYYERIAYDTVATIVNDLVTVGARPLAIHAFWAVGSVEWISDKKKMANLVRGWKKACDASLASWGGGESPTLKDSINKKSIVLGGSCVGIIGDEERLMTYKKIKSGDRIILIKSTGVNANGLSLVRAVAKKLPKGYLTKLSNGKSFGEAILNKTNIYAGLVQNLLDEGVNIHYISNITGHGLRKIMRAKKRFTYIIEKIIEPSEEFILIQKTASLSDYEIYATLNMGMDYALLLDKKDVLRTLKIISQNKFFAIDAGYVKRGERQVIVKPLEITYKGNTLDLR